MILSQGKDQTRSRREHSGSKLLRNGTIFYDQRMQLRKLHPNDTRRTILFWTKFFQDKWDINSESFAKCNHNCRVTYDKDELSNADALLFHFTDVPDESPPEVRNLDQPWLIFMHESTVHIWANWNRYYHFFNWTVAYRSDSSVFYPYRSVKYRPNARRYRQIEIANKTKFAYTAVSNNNAFSHRYKILNDLRKINKNVDFYGTSYGKKCEVKDFYCLKKENVGKYFFRFAFENSNCKDYVTEKYWETLDFDVIPVVAWVEGQRPPNIPPRSYINFHDFSSLEEFNSYLINVSQDKTLFNSYFLWRENYELVDDGACNLCDALHDQHRQRQSIDLESWLSSDFCQPSTVWTFLWNIIERNLFNIGMA
ncbi:hypothetical protein FSP39_003418 [Pinctada imbricata]|uniref:Fucosyltransferase n=1 Tax=Pinctada imbricata TaxID=66713 RepID=A0AA88XUT7_PINIB|nr:hypothetical protein FSP39_003418 [Pinctada imbricata]